MPLKVPARRPDWSLVKKLPRRVASTSLTQLGSSGLLPFECLQFFQSLRPLRSEQPRQTAIGEDYSARLTSGTVVCLVIGVANTQNLFGTSRARLPVTAMDGHSLVKRSDFVGETGAGFGLQAIDPVLKRVTRSNEQPFPLIRPESMGKRNRR